MCGNHGCLETVVNQAYLYEQYRVNVLRQEGFSQDKNDMYSGLLDLFTRAKNGQKEALEIIETAGRYLGSCLAHAVSILDINNIIISGSFGPDGDVILDSVKSQVENDTLPGLRCEIQYAPFEPMGYLKGAAFLILKDYLVDIP
jgi:transcriptional regulator of PTS gene